MNVRSRYVTKVPVIVRRKGVTTFYWGYYNMRVKCNYCVDCDKMIAKISKTIGETINQDYINVDVDAYYVPYRPETVTEPAEGGYAEDFVVEFKGKDITSLFPSIEKDDYFQDLIKENCD